MDLRAIAIRWGAALLLFAVGLEAGTRVLFPRPEVLGFDRVNYQPAVVRPAGEHSDSLGNASFVWPSDPDDVEFVHHLNLYGFRDRPWHIAPGTGRRRLLFVGDSLTEGFMAEDHESIPARFREHMRHADLEVEVMNLGVGASNLREYFHLIRDAVPTLAPAEIFLVLYTNDFAPGPYEPSWLAPAKPGAFSEPTGPWALHVVAAAIEGRRVPRRWIDAPFAFFAAVPDPRNPWSDATKASAFAAHVDSEVAGAMRAGRFNPFSVDLLLAYEYILSHPADLTAHLSALQRFLAKSQTRLRIVYLPIGDQVSDAYRRRHLSYSRAPKAASFTAPAFQRLNRELRRTCAALNIDCFDLSPRLRELESQGERLYWAYDEHMNASGYAAAAQAIFDWWDGLLQ